MVQSPGDSGDEGWRVLGIGADVGLVNAVVGALELAAACRYDVERGTYGARMDGVMDVVALPQHQVVHAKASLLAADEVATNEVGRP